MDQHQQTPLPAAPAAPAPPGRRLGPQAALWASAFVLIALIVIQAGRMSPEARADLVASSGDMTAITVESTSDDVLLVVDNRTDSLMAYKIVNQRELEHRKTYHLPRLFADARNRSGRK